MKTTSARIAAIAATSALALSGATGVANAQSLEAELEAGLGSLSADNGDGSLENGSLQNGSLGEGSLGDVDDENGEPVEPGDDDATGSLEGGSLDAGSLDAGSAGAGSALPLVALGGSAAAVSIGLPMVQEAVAGGQIVLPALPAGSEIPGMQPAPAQAPAPGPDIDNGRG